MRALLSATPFSEIWSPRTLSLPNGVVKGKVSLELVTVAMVFDICSLESFRLRFRLYQGGNSQRPVYYVVFEVKTRPVQRRSFNPQDMVQLMQPCSLLNGC